MRVSTPNLFSTNTEIVCRISQYRRSPKTAIPLHALPKGYCVRSARTRKNRFTVLVTHTPGRAEVQFTSSSPDAGMLFVGPPMSAGITTLLLGTNLSSKLEISAQQNIVPDP